jgi:hypothetical protein
MEKCLKLRFVRRPVITSPVKSFASIYNALCASGLQDE